jgi:hypothetical protein
VEDEGTRVKMFLDTRHAVPASYERNSKLIMKLCRSFELFAHAILMAMICIAVNGTRVAGNELLIGAKARTTAVIRVNISEPICLNFMSKDEIFKLRKTLIENYPSLNRDNYVPSEDVFGQVASQKPWWGLYGKYVYRVGQRSIEGPSDQSKFILNPYLLVAADQANVGLWNADKVTKQMLTASSFPFFWKPQELKWYPGEARSEVTYDVSGYQRALYSLRYALKFYRVIDQFSLIAYNAKDFGLNYLFFAGEKSRNVINKYRNREPIEILQMIHLGETCGYPGGCNNMSPYMPELEQLSLTGLPAHARILLWKQKPSSINAQPDMTLDLNFK